MEHAADFRLRCGKNALEYQIYIEADGAVTPHFEPVFAQSMDEARTAAIGLLRQRPRATQALIYDRENLLAMIDPAA